MHRNTGARGRAGVTLAVTAVFAAGLFFSPASASASSIVVRQILPPSEQACPQVGVSEVTSYVYDGTLNSFEMNVTDPSYVAVGGTVGDQAISFQYMTRKLNPDGTLRIHVDLQNTSLATALPIELTLISAHAGNTARTCIATISAIIPAVSGGSAPAQIPSHPSYPSHPAQPSKPSHPSTGTGTGTHKPTTTVSVGEGMTPVLGASRALGKLCINATGTARLWIVLVVLYAIFIGILLAQGNKDRTPHLREWHIGTILVILVVLLLFWYMAPSCRAGAWAPALATLVACIGCIFFTQRGEQMDSPLLLEAKKEEKVALLKEEAKPEKKKGEK